jgi:hypothetical protein
MNNVTDLAEHRAKVEEQVNRHLDACEAFETALREEVWDETSRLLNGFLDEYQGVMPALVAQNIVGYLVGGAVAIIQENGDGSASDFLLWLKELSSESVEELDIQRDRDDPVRQEWRRLVYSHRLTGTNNEHDQTEEDKPK